LEISHRVGPNPDVTAEFLARDRPQKPNDLEGCICALLSLLSQ